MVLNSFNTEPVDEIIHGDLVHDSYRWLEDRSLRETKQWIEEQQNRCNGYFRRCNHLDLIREQVRAYLAVEIIDQPARVRDRCFYRRRKPQQEQACLCVQDRTKQERVLIDPNSTKRFVSVAIHSISEDASLLAYEVKQGGGDRKVIRFVDVKTGCILPDKIPNGYARGLSFLSDGSGYIYCHETAQDVEEHTIVLHHFHEPANDQIVFRAPRSHESRLLLAADATHLGAIWMHRLGDHRVVSFWLARRENPEAWHQVLANESLPFCPMLKQGRIFALSYQGAPNGRLLELSECGAELHTIIPEHETAIRQVTFTKTKVYSTYFDAWTSLIRCRHLSGRDFGTIDTPPNGTIRLLPNHSDQEDAFFVTYESFTEPPVILEYLPQLARFDVWHRRRIPSARHPLQIKQSTYASTDGSQIPITLVSRRTRRTAKGVPAIMTSYGGFGISSTPQFSILVGILLEAGAIFAMPHVRGGGEFGSQWHEAARGRKRQVSFSDFLSAAQWLCDEKLTSPSQLAIFGGSNSGLLVGVAMTQRPDLFRAVLCIAPLLDMVRYEHFDQAVKWRHEYGRVEDPDDFRALHEYSPYHHIETDKDYPAVLFVSGDQDDRCNPAHVRKMAARLQSRSAQKRPVLVDYSKHRGHSPVLPLSIRIEVLARRVAFLCRELNLSIGE